MPVRTVLIMQCEEVPTDAGRGPAWTRLLSRAFVPPRPPQFRAATIADDWPLRTSLELGALPGAVPCARLHTRQVLWEWGFAALVETIELIVSELVTNAIQASEGLTGGRYDGRWTPGVPPVRLWLLSDRQRVVIRVWDSDHQVPRLQDAELDAEDGRGLLLVECLSNDWGSYLAENSSGKVVWALIEQSQ